MSASGASARIFEPNASLLMHACGAGAVSLHLRHVHTTDINIYSPKSSLRVYNYDKIRRSVGFNALQHDLRHATQYRDAGPLSYLEITLYLISEYVILSCLLSFR